MKVTYDEEADAIYLRLKETPYYESDEIKEGLILDYDKEGNLIGVEILDASEYLSPQELATLSFNIERALAK
jgi:uncharacterized protein YuzE